MQDLQQTVHTLPVEDRSYFTSEEDHHMSDLLENEELLSALYVGSAIWTTHPDP